jgi:hypothetical protein
MEKGSSRSSDYFKSRTPIKMAGGHCIQGAASSAHGRSGLVGLAMQIKSYTDERSPNDRSRVIKVCIIKNRIIAENTESIVLTKTVQRTHKLSKY